MRYVASACFLAVLAQCGGPAATQARDPADARLPDAVDLRTSPSDFGFRRAPGNGHWAWLRLAGDAAHYEARALSLLVAAGGGAPPTELPVHGKAAGGDHRALGPVWFPDGKAVAVAYHASDGDHSTIACVDRIAVPSGEASPLLRPHAATIECIDVGPDGRLAIVIGTGATNGDDAGMQLQVVGADGKLERSIPIPTSRSYGAAASFAPDGRAIAFVSDRGLWFVDGDAEPRRVWRGAVESVQMAAPRWQPDGSAVLVAAGGAVVWASHSSDRTRCWSPGQLGGRCVDAALLPGGHVGAAAIAYDVEGGVVSLLLGAGHASRTPWVKVLMLSIADGEVGAKPALATALDENGRWQLPYVPRLSELLAAR